MAEIIDDLKTLLPDEIYTLESGEQVVVRPVPFGKLKIFSKAIASLTLKLTELGMKLRHVEDWMMLFDVAFDETMDLMGLVLDKPRNWFDVISINDGIGLLTIIIDQNLKEETKKNILRMVEKFSSPQQTSSRSSSQQGIAGKKSKGTQ